MLKKVNRLVERVNSFTPKSAKELNDFRVEYLGKKGVLNDLFSAFKTVPVNEKKEFGSIINNLKTLVQEKIGLYANSFEVEEKKRYALCTCKYSRNPPFCDGSHKGLD